MTGQVIAGPPPIPVDTHMGVASMPGNVIQTNDDAMLAHQLWALYKQAVHNIMRDADVGSIDILGVQISIEAVTTGQGQP